MATKILMLVFEQNLAQNYEIFTPKNLGYMVFMYNNAVSLKRTPQYTL